MSIGPLLRAAREQAGLNQVTAAASAGITQSRLSQYELDKHAPGPAILGRMADVYGCTVDQLLGRAPLPDAEPTAGGAA